MSNEISVKLGGDNSGFRSMLGDSEKRASDFGKSISKKFDMSSLIGGGMTALGIGLAELFRKSGEAIIRTVTGISEAEEAAFKRLEDLSTRATDAAIKNMRDQLSDEQKYQLALQERDSLLRKIAVGATQSGVDQVRLAEAKIKLEERNAEILTYEKKQKEEQRKLEEQAAKDAAELVQARRQATEREFQAALELLATNERIVALKSTVAAQEAAIASGAFRGKELDAQREQLAERRVDLAKEETKVKEKAAEIDKKNFEAEADAEAKTVRAKRETLSIAEQRKLVTEDIRRLTREIVAGETDGLDVTKQIKQVDELRGELRSIEKQQNADNVEIATLLLKGAEELTDAEKLRLSVLMGQTTQAKIQAELADLTKKILDGSITPAERTRLGVLTQQTVTIERQNEKLKEQVSLIRNTYGKADKDLSDRELSEKIANLRKQLQDARNSNDTGAFFFQQKLNETQFEADRRRNFRQQYASQGEAALLRYSAFDEQTLRNYIRPEDERRAQKDSDALSDIQQRLMLIFPKK